MKLPLIINIDDVNKKLIFLKYLAKERGYPAETINEIGLFSWGDTFTVVCPKEARDLKCYSRQEDNLTAIVIHLIDAIRDQINYLKEEASESLKAFKRWENIYKKYEEDKNE